MRQRALIGLVAALAASAALGLVTGLIWHEVAPRVALLEVSAGTAQVVSAETRAFMGADSWFCLLGAVAGLVTGVAGYALGIARRPVPTRVAVTVGLIAGGVAGGYVMLWLGQQLGQSAYQGQLAHAATGTTFNAALVLGAKSALAFWPMVTALVIVLAEVGGRKEASGPPEPAGEPPGPGPASSMWTGPHDPGGPQ
jgi:hypothetical protein